MIDASIPLRANPVQFQDPTNALAKVLQVRALADDGEYRRAAAQEKQRALAETNALNTLYAGAYGPDGKLDRTKLITGAAQANLGSRIPAIQKQLADADKAEADVEKTRGETVAQRLKQWADTAKHVRTPEQAAGYISAQYDDPIIGPIIAKLEPREKALASLPTNPAAVADWAMQAEVGIGKFAEHQRALAQQAEAARHNRAGEANTVRGQDILVDNNKRSVGASYANAQAMRDAAQTQASATRDAASIKDRRDTEMKLGDDYRAQSKNFKDVQDAAARVKAALPNASKSAASTLAAATSFMKLLDPGSVVRESELGMALAATGAFDRAMNYFNVLQRGKVLTPDQVADFTATTEKIVEAAKQGQLAVDADYQGKAKQYGLRAEMITQDLGQNRPAAAPPPAAAGLSAAEEKELQELRARLKK